MNEPDNEPAQPVREPAPQPKVGPFGGEEGQVVLSADPQSWDRLRWLLRALARPPGIIIVVIVLVIVAIVIVTG
jgi:hypothetical protein